MQQYRMGTGIKSWKAGVARSVSFVVTEDCSLRCKYCYMVHKNNKKRMSFETAARAVDFLFGYWPSADAIILEFIGGEPFLEIGLIDKIVDYFVLQAYKMDHPWFTNYRINMSTNGLLYSDENVQRFIRKNAGKLSIGITIDGTKEKHDMQRVYADGSGSYDQVVKQIPLWLKQFPNASTKVTVGHEDLHLLADSVIHLWDLGIKEVPANVVFEDVWLEGDDVILEEQMVKLADYALKTGRWKDHDCSFFSETLGYPHTEGDLKNNWCGAGKMLAVDSGGVLYPCIRYMDYSLANKSGYPIGTLRSGVVKDRVRPFLALNVPTQSDPECLDCEVARGCAWCQAYNYDSSNPDTNFQRSKSICAMHKARVRANSYYWGRLRSEFGITRLGAHRPKKHLYVMASTECTSHCNYVPSREKRVVMSEDIAPKVAKFAGDNFYRPVVLHDRDMTLSRRLLKSFATLEALHIIPAECAPDFAGENVDLIPNYSLDCALNGQIESRYGNVILTVDGNEIAHLHEATARLLENVSRVNLNIRSEQWDFDCAEYESQLAGICELLGSYYLKGSRKEFSKITDCLYLKTMENCGAGIHAVAVGPNGLLYLCPATYYHGESALGSIESGVSSPSTLYAIEKSSICSLCDSYHCNRCVVMNKRSTSEYCVPSERYCRITHLERGMSKKLRERLVAAGASPKKMRELPEIDYGDPLDLILREKSRGGSSVADSSSPYSDRMH